MREWSVDLKTLHTLGPDLTRVEAYVDDLVGILKPFALAAGYDSLGVTPRFNVRARTVDAALTKALRIFAASFKRIHFPDPPDVVSAEVETVEELDRRLQEANFLDLVGIPEGAGALGGCAGVAEILGVTRQRAAAPPPSRRSPKPIAQLAAGPVWDRHAIARFVERWPRRRTGRAQKGGGGAGRLSSP